MTIETLPVEAWSQIIHWIALDPSDDGDVDGDDSKNGEFRSNLGNVRLSCKLLSQLASRELFSTVYLYPTEDSIAKSDNILSSAYIRPMVRELRVEAMPWSGHGGNRLEQPQAWRDLVERMYEFPNMNAVDLKLEQSCWADEGADEEHGECLMEGEENRQRNLTLCFRAMAKLNGVEGRRIAKLTVGSLHSTIRGDIVSSKEFESVLSKLDELCVHVCCADLVYHRHDEVVYGNPAVWTPWPVFNDSWLKHAVNITALTISSKWSWGTMPLWYNRDLYFPKLKTLSLHNYIITWQSQVDWILKHKALTHLKLSELCMSRYYRVQPYQTGRVDFSAVEVVHSPTPGQCILLIRQEENRLGNALVWDDVEDGFYDKLPELRVFVMYGGQRDCFITGIWSFSVKLLGRSLRHST